MSTHYSMPEGSSRVLMERPVKPIPNYSVSVCESQLPQHWSKSELIRNGEEVSSQMGTRRKSRKGASELQWHPHVTTAHGWKCQPGSTASFWSAVNDKFLTWQTTVPMSIWQTTDPMSIWQTTVPMSVWQTTVPMSIWQIMAPMSIWLATVLHFYNCVLWPPFLCSHSVTSIGILSFGFLSWKKNVGRS